MTIHHRLHDTQGQAAALPPEPAPTHSGARHPLLALTDRCVMCGLCLPHCPTYAKTRDEAESPRGRVALIQAMLQGQLQPERDLLSHLDHCLSCRSCEAVCPSGVAFGRIMDGARAELQRRHVRATRLRGLQRALVDPLLTSRRVRRLAAGAARMYQRSGLRALARRSGVLRLLGLQRAERLLPELRPLERWQAYYPPTAAQRGEVALFIGCAADVVDQAALGAAIRVLNRLGYGVHVPRDQTCCGALHLHDGDAARARALAQRNLAAFAATKAERVIVTASGCAAQLFEYGSLQELERQDAAEFSARVRDVNQFLAEIEWPEDVRPAPLSMRAAVHEPCSVTNVLRQRSRACALLKRIPDIEVVPLAGNARCCGAAGSYLLTQPAMSDALLADKLADIGAAQADVVVTSNVGCALHLAAGMRAAGITLEILHPVTLLDRQLRDDPG